MHVQLRLDSFRETRACRHSFYSHATLVKSIFSNDLFNPVLILSD